MYLSDDSILIHPRLLPYRVEKRALEERINFHDIFYVRNLFFFFFVGGMKENKILKV